MTYDEAKEIALQSEWKTYPCPCGEDLCGVLWIELVEPIKYERDGEEWYFTDINGPGEPIWFVEHIVEAHNKMIFESDGRRDTRYN